MLRINYIKFPIIFVAPFTGKSYFYSRLRVLTLRLLLFPLSQASSSWTKFHPLTNPVFAFIVREFLPAEIETKRPNFSNQIIPSEHRSILFHHRRFWTLGTVCMCFIIVPKTLGTFLFGKASWKRHTIENYLYSTRNLKKCLKYLRR